MERTVVGAGSLLLRGLGPSGLLISRGLGAGFDATVIVTVPTLERPRQLRYRGGHGKEEQKTEEIKCYFVRARLVEINDQVITQPIEGEIKVCYGIDKFKVRSTLPSVTKRRSSLKVKIKLIT